MILFYLDVCKFDEERILGNISANTNKNKLNYTCDFSLGYALKLNHIHKIIGLKCWITNRQITRIIIGKLILIRIISRIHPIRIFHDNVWFKSNVKICSVSKFKGLFLFFLVYRFLFSKNTKQISVFSFYFWQNILFRNQLSYIIEYYFF